MNRKRTEQGQNRAAEEETNCRKYAVSEQSKNREQNNTNAEKEQNAAVKEQTDHINYWEKGTEHCRETAFRRCARKCF